MPARYDLKRVKSYAQQALDDPIKEVVWFSVPKKSYSKVVEEFQLCGRPMDPLAAKVYILETILELSEKYFWKVQQQWEDDFADWYGIVKDQIPWLIKFLISQEEGQEYLDQISFRRPEWDMQLENGTVIKTNGEIIQ